MAKYPGLRRKAWKACIVEELQMCAEDHILHRMLAVWKGFERQYALTTGSSATDSGYITSDWEIFGDEYFAKKVWIKENSEIVETGTFKLYHTPGQ